MIASLVVFLAGLAACDTHPTRCFARQVAKDSGDPAEKCTAVRSGSKLELISPAFVYRLDVADGLKGVAWENRLTGKTIPLGSGREVEFDLDAADSRVFITGWKMASGQPGFVQPDDEGGYKQGCAAYDFDDSGWYGRTPPMSYGTPESPDLSDYYWARTRVFLPKDIKDKDLSIVLGGFGLFEYRYMRVFVNGHEVGTRRYSTRWTQPGMFDLGPKSKVHQFLRFGQDNVIALQLAGYKCRTAKLERARPAASERPLCPILLAGTVRAVSGRRQADGQSQASSDGRQDRAPAETTAKSKSNSRRPIPRSRPR